MRTTITPQTVERQAEIVAYLHEHLGAQEIRFEPVYKVRGMGWEGFTAADAKWFVDHFLSAQHDTGAYDNMSECRIHRQLTYPKKG